ncbi:oligopeptide ABC transporter permease OppB [Mesoplasma corruscae]|uniref:Oligopeptide ABC transporter permease n=1 Tax=Mesoplasma corruscae TaxID=216874 RepID=A0A2S5RHA7_9MOLU|nr:oligopeptide ABC transporter permease OppB [Mesoplasma corruscae]PPE06716.1 oligopeptide ABC transporter permease [Mesoplasma corruscae]
MIEKANNKLDDLIEKVSHHSVNKRSSQNLLYHLKYFFGESNNKIHEFTKKTPLFFYSLKRIGYSLLTILMAVIVIYCLFHFVMKDETLIKDLNGVMDKLKLFPGNAKYERIVSSRKKMVGLDGPLLYQIFIYIRNIIPVIPKTVFIQPKLLDTGDLVATPIKTLFFLGLSVTDLPGFHMQTPVQTIFKDAMPSSFKLGFPGVLLSYVFGIPLGIIAGKNKDRKADRLINALCSVFMVIPAVVTITIFYSVSLSIGGSTSWVLGGIETKIYAILCVVIFSFSGITLYTRRLVVDEMTTEYTKFAQSKGLSSRYIFFVHIYRNAFIKMAGSIPATFASTIFGLNILVEGKWGVRGMGSYVSNAINGNDIFVAMGYVVISAVVGVFAGLLGDLLTAALDPRIKFR